MIFLFLLFGRTRGEIRGADINDGVRDAGEAPEPADPNDGVIVTPGAGGEEYRGDRAPRGESPGSAENVMISGDSEAVVCAEVVVTVVAVAVVVVCVVVALRFNFKLLLFGDVLFLLFELLLLLKSVAVFLRCNTGLLNGEVFGEFLLFFVSFLVDLLVVIVVGVSVGVSVGLLDVVVVVLLLFCCCCSAVCADIAIPVWSKLMLRRWPTFGGSIFSP